MTLYKHDIALSLYLSYNSQEDNLNPNIINRQKQKLQLFFYRFSLFILSLTKIFTKTHFSELETLFSIHVNYMILIKFSFHFPLFTYFKNCKIIPSTYFKKEKSYNPHNLRENLPLRLTPASHSTPISPIIY